MSSSKTADSKGGSSSRATTAASGTASKATTKPAYSRMTAQSEESCDEPIGFEVAADCFPPSAKRHKPKKPKVKKESEYSEYSTTTGGSKKATADAATSGMNAGVSDAGAASVAPLSMGGATTGVSEFTTGAESEVEVEKWRSVCIPIPRSAVEQPCETCDPRKRVPKCICSKPCRLPLGGIIQLDLKPDTPQKELVANDMGYQGYPQQGFPPQPGMMMPGMAPMPQQPMVPQQPMMPDQMGYYGQPQPGQYLPQPPQQPGAPPGKGFCGSCGGRLPSQQGCPPPLPQNFPGAVPPQSTPCGPNPGGY